MNGFAVHDAPQLTRMLDTLETEEPGRWQISCNIDREEIKEMRFDSPFVTALVVGGAVAAAVAMMYAPGEGRAMAALRSRRASKAREPKIDEQIEESFPASDPPSWTPVTSTNPTEATRSGQ